MERENMKVKCPICGIEGFLEKRGNSYRIKHYKGYVNGKRKYVVHSIKKEQLQLIPKIGNQSMGIKTLNLASEVENLRGCRLAWSRLRDSGSRDPGSNPGSPTILSYLSEKSPRKMLKIIDEF